MQPGGRFQKSGLLLCLCRRKLVQDKVNQFTAARTPFETRAAQSRPRWQQAFANRLPVQSQCV
jgi:hypothetical protein